MSKPIARITLVILISLVLIAVTSASARSWLGSTSETASVQAHTVSGLQTNFNHQRSTVAELESQAVQQLQETQPGKSRQGGGGCESEYQSDSTDL